MATRSTCRPAAAMPCRRAMSVRSRTRSGPCSRRGSRRPGRNKMADLLLRGRVLSFLRWPDSADDYASCRYEEDGGVLIDGGKIAAVGGYAGVARQASPGTKTIDHRPHLILPGFIDAHIHVPQMQVIASYGAELLD